MADLTGVHVEGVTSLILLSTVDTSYTQTLRTTICRLGHLDTVGGDLRAADEVTADSPSSFRTGAFSASIIYKVGVSLRYLSVLEASVDTVVVLVTLTCAPRLGTSGTTGTALQDLLHTVVENRAIHSSAVSLAQTAT